MRKLWVGLCTGLLVLAAAAAVLIPVYRSAAENRMMAEKARQLIQLLEEMEPELVQKHLNIARWYNYTLKTEGIGEAYQGVLDLSEGAMGVLAVPTVGLAIPISHASDDLYLYGTVHRQDSALPVGGLGNHTILECASGNRNGDRMRQIGRLRVGDTVYIFVPGGPLAYVVTHVTSMPVEEWESPAPEENQDLCSLILHSWTNADHRLTVITCARTENGAVAEAVFTGASLNGNVIAASLCAATGAGLLPLVLGCMVSHFSGIHRKRKQKPRKTQNRRTVKML